MKEGEEKCGERFERVEERARKEGREMEKAGRHTKKKIKKR